MCADPAPDDVDLTGLDLGSGFPGSPTVRSERHLHDVAGPLHAFHPETGPEWTTRFQILDKPGNRSTKPLLLGRAERSPVLVDLCHTDTAGRSANGTPSRADDSELAG